MRSRLMWWALAALVVVVYARVLGFDYDTGERYLSVPDFLPEA